MKMQAYLSLNASEDYLLYIYSFLHKRKEGLKVLKAY